MYKLPLNNMGLGALDTQHGRKFVYNFWLPQNLPSSSLLLTGSLTNNKNSQLTCILCVVCSMHCVLTVNWGKELVAKTFVRKRKHIYSTVHVCRCCKFTSSVYHVNCPLVLHQHCGI